jgi:hypothetical protein
MKNADGGHILFFAKHPAFEIFPLFLVMTGICWVSPILQTGGRSCNSKISEFGDIADLAIRIFIGRESHFPQKESVFLSFLQKYRHSAQNAKLRDLRSAAVAVARVGRQQSTS